MMNGGSGGRKTAAMLQMKVIEVRQEVKWSKMEQMNGKEKKKKERNKNIFYLLIYYDYFLIIVFHVVNDASFFF